MHVQVLLPVVLGTLNVFGTALNIPEKRQMYQQNEALQPKAADQSPNSKPNYITAFKKELVPSNLKVKGAKRLTLWYKTLEFSKQANQSVLQDGTYYQSVGFPESFQGNAKVFKSTLRDFLGNATILRAKVNFLDELERPAIVDNGMFIGQAAISSDPLLSLLMGCEDNRYLLPWFPHTIPKSGQDGGPDMFTNPDGSDPTIGLWARRFFSQQELIVEGVSLDPDRNKTVIAKIELDFLEGRPRRVSYRQFFEPEACGPQTLVKDPNGGPKKFISKNEKPLHFRMSGDIIAIQPSVQTGGVEMKVKVNGKVVCSSRAEYLTLPQNPRKPDSKPWQKLISMSPCNETVKITLGDKLDLESHYDFEAHPVPEFVETQVTTTGRFGKPETAERLHAVYVTFAQFPKKPIDPDLLDTMLMREPGSWKNIPPGELEEQLIMYGEPEVPPELLLPPGSS